MRFIMSHHIGLQVLRAKIRGFHAAGATIASRISKSQKEHKNRLWDEKRLLGRHCRHHLIAYGLLRGIPYAHIERCAPNNRPDPKAILEIVSAHNRWTPKGGLVKYDLAMVEGLLASEPQTPEQANPTAVAVLSASPPPPVAPSCNASSTASSRLLRALRLPFEKRA
jgi:hypothetical protein